jgi:hypothetical protein
MRFGQLIRETKTVPARHGAITEEQAIAFFDRSSMFSQYVEITDQTDDLSLLFAYPAHGSTHAGYVAESNEWASPSANEWVMVYRYYPQEEPARSTAMDALNEWHANIPSTFETMGKPNNSEGL